MTFNVFHASLLHIVLQWPAIFVYVFCISDWTWSSQDTFTNIVKLSSSVVLLVIRQNLYSVPRPILHAGNTIRSNAKPCPPRTYSLVERRALSGGGIKQDIESTGTTEWWVRANVVRDHLGCFMSERYWGLRRTLGRNTSDFTGNLGKRCVGVEESIGYQ